jgi:hypothetical protein
MCYTNFEINSVEYNLIIRRSYSNEKESGDKWLWSYRENGI